MNQQIKECLTNHSETVLCIVGNVGVGSLRSRAASRNESITSQDEVALRPFPVTTSHTPGLFFPVSNTKLTSQLVDTPTFPAGRSRRRVLSQNKSLKQRVEELSHV